MTSPAAGFSSICGQEHAFPDEFEGASVHQSGQQIDPEPATQIHCACHPVFEKARVDAQRGALELEITGAWIREIGIIRNGVGS